MTARPLRRSYWLIGGFVSAVLILLVAVPLVLSYRVGSLISELDQQADPADQIAGQIQTALFHEISGILGFQTTAEARYTELYRQQTSTITEGISELERLTGNLDSHVRARFMELRSGVDHWHQDVETYHLATVQRPKGEFQQVLFQREYVFEAAHQAAARFTDAVARWRAAQRARIGSVARLDTNFTVAFALLALLAMTLVANIVRRLSNTSAYLEVRAREEEALRQVAHSLTSAVTLDDVLHRITQTASYAAGAEAVYIETIDATKDEITCVAGYGSGVPPTGTKGPYSRSVAHDVLRDREPRIIRDVSVERDRRSVFGEFARRCENCAAMVVPLIADNQPLGALFLVRRHPKYFTDAEFPRVRILADMASLAMQRALTLERLQKLQSEEHFLSEAATVLASSLDYDTTIKTVVRLAVPRIADWCAVHVVDDAGNIKLSEVAHDDPAKVALAEQLQKKYPPRAHRDSGVFRVIRTGKPELYSEITDEMLEQTAEDAEHLELLRQLNLKSAMVVPLSASGQTFGALTFVTERDRYYGHDDLTFAEDVARHAALAIQNARLYTSTERAIRVRDDVLRVVSHDLRNPVNNIQMTALVLLNSSLPEEKRQSLVQIINRASERMNRLIDDLVAVARVREGQEITLDVRAENPSEIIDAACNAFSVQAQAKVIRLTCDRNNALPAVKADHHRILQVLFNLIDNAIKFTPEGGTITVGCKAQENGILFAVKDTGRGIEKAHLGRIFDLFWQAKPTAHMGAGFGLAIAKSIVEQHGGKIWADSKPGLGTTVFFTLPHAGRKEDAA